MNNTPIRQIITGMDKWQWVGFVTREGDMLVITNASNIRRWGRPLGELALKGPGRDTVLDFCGRVSFPFINLVNAHDCDESIWSKL